MCGLTGFFVGCNLADSCARAVSCHHRKVAYRSAFKNWDERASVRSSSRLILGEGELFPKDLVPVLAHPIVQNMSEENRNALQADHLIRFLNFTHKLELLVVNDVTMKIALSSYGFALSDEVSLDAHRIFVDEAYHGMFSFDILSQVQRRLQIKVPQPGRPPLFIQKLQRLCDAYDARTAEFLRLMFVVASEMLITDTLRSVHKRTDLDGGIRDMVADHARDEARHHAFYKSVFMLIWPQLNENLRKLASSYMPTFIRIFVEPDKDDIAEKLRSCGLKTDEARQVVEETYALSVVNTYAGRCGTALLDLLDEVTSSNEQNHHREVAESIGLT